MALVDANFSDFIEEILSDQMVFTLEDDGGIPCPTNAQGKTTMPFWSSRTRAEKITILVTAYEGFRVREIPLENFLEKWLPGLVRDGADVGINWSGQKALGYDVDPQGLKQEIEEYLSENSVEGPDGETEDRTEDSATPEASEK
ncbi:MAG: DUF2750 domain-containing protein [Candidatus Ozemobacteraceae bacterium]